ncbi:helix-turn-helix domain-containing protein [Candidatus Neomarinimicrobiota bacterium]
MTELTIKNMVCARCIRVVSEELFAGGFNPIHVQLGKVVLNEQLNDAATANIKSILERNGFELLVDGKAQLVEQIKAIIIDLVYNSELSELNVNISDFIANKIGRDYSSLSNLFSSVESTTIEKYIISQKIERVKELLVYNELNLSEIAFMLGYSSVQHLSNQFKKVTGLTATHFKQLGSPHRRSLDQL